jgi:hypothetical protein
MRFGFLAFICFFLIQCKPQSGYEAEICACVQTHYAQHGIDFDAKLKAFESSLISKNFLPSADGEGYQLALGKLAQGVQMPSFESGLFETFDRISPELVSTPLDSCKQVISDLSSAAYAISDCQAHWTLAVEAMNARLAAGEFVPEMMWQEIHRHLTVEDLDGQLFPVLLYVTASAQIDTEQGILRQLPPPRKTQNTGTIALKDVFRVLVNGEDQIMIESEVAEVEDIRPRLRHWLTCSGVFEELGESDECAERQWLKSDELNHSIEQTRKLLEQASSEDQRDLERQLKRLERKQWALEYFGEYNEQAPYSYVSMRNDNGTSYEMYLQVQNELQGALLDLRNELALEHFGKTYVQLEEETESDEEAHRKVWAIRAVYPQRITEAEPY